MCDRGGSAEGLTILLQLTIMRDMTELEKKIEELVCLNGMDRVLDALVEICDPLKHTPEVQKLNPGLYHDWAVLKAAQLALSDQRFVVRVEVATPYSK